MATATTLATKLTPCERNIDVPAIRALLPRGWAIDYHDVSGGQDEYLRLTHRDIPLSGGGGMQFSGVAGARHLIEILVQCGASLNHRANHRTFLAEILS